MKNVRRRCVFYVSGFDPKGAAYYHALYKEQAALAVKAGGVQLAVGPRKRLPSGNSAWTVLAQDGQKTVETWYEFLKWDDIVRDNWPRSQWALWRDVLVTSWFYLRTKTLWRMYLLSWPPALALFIPFLLLVTVLVGGPALSIGTALLTLRAGANVGVALLVALILAALVLWSASRAEQRWSMYWMMRSYAFTRLQALGRAPALEARLDTLASRVAQRLQEGGDDEVLLIGHSSGAIMACAVAARALRMQGKGQGTPLSLLTLGQWLPLLALVPHASGFRSELSELVTTPSLTWVDFSAPPDGCCFALSDPYSGCDIPPVAVPFNRPKLLSPRFAAMFEPDDYQRLRRDKLQLHFQYLMAAPKKTEYDFFAITAGAKTLSDRYSAAPSVENYGDLRPLRWLRRAPH